MYLFVASLVGCDSLRKMLWHVKHIMITTDQYKSNAFSTALMILETLRRYKEDPMNAHILEVRDHAEEWGGGATSTCKRWFYFQL